MSEESFKDFVKDLEDLIRQYQYKLVNYECHSALVLAADSISSDIRKPPDIGPSPLS